MYDEVGAARRRQIRDDEADRYDPARIQDRARISAVLLARIRIGTFPKEDTCPACGRAAEAPRDASAEASNPREETRVGVCSDAYHGLAIHSGETKRLYFSAEAMERRRLAYVAFRVLGVL